MTTPQGDLPQFDQPPVIETVLGVFFRPIRGFNSVWQGLFWNERLRSNFAEFELRTPLDEIPERFDDPLTSFQTGVRWEVSSEPDTPRLWAKSPAGGEHILQLQRNALLANWLRKTGYKSFSERLSDFAIRLQDLDSFLTSRGITDKQLSPVSSIVTYINHIPIEEGCNWDTSIGKILRCWSNPLIGSWLPPVERGRLNFSFAFAEKFGRLHVSVVPAQQRDTKMHVIQLELTGRLALIGESVTLAQAIEALATAHDWVVKGFADLTRPEMHTIWGRRQ